MPSSCFVMLRGAHGSPTHTFVRPRHLAVAPPPPGKAWIDYATWDDRVERFRVPALHYRRLVEALRAEGTRLVDQAPAFAPLPLVSALEMPPYPHQRAALAAWRTAGRQGIVVLPTGAARTFLAQLPMLATQQSALIVVPNSPPIASA